jgi:Cu+-exporting ATPase
MARDPLCGMEVDESSAKHTIEYQGQQYSFCAPGCTKALEAEPQTYLDPNYKPSM